MFDQVGYPLPLPGLDPAAPLAGEANPGKQAAHDEQETCQQEQNEDGNDNDNENENDHGFPGDHESYGNYG